MGLTPSLRPLARARQSTAEIAIGSTVLLKVKGYPEWPGKASLVLPRERLREGARDGWAEQLNPPVPRSTTTGRAVVCRPQALSSSLLAALSLLAH